ncbi:MAG: hypothetical protein KY468_12585 [Armatimonadetes bacterium]|nr:hypothetical protein [Armatimonadota bacterium]
MFTVSRQKHRLPDEAPGPLPTRRTPAVPRYRLWLAVAVIGGFLFKLLSLLFIAHDLRGYGLEPMGWDSPSYYEPAMTLARSFTFHSEVRTPGYPAFLALIYALTRDPNPVSTLNLSAVFIAQSLLLSLGCLPIAGAVRRLTGNERLAVGGAFLWAFNNSARYYANIILTEAWATFLACLWVYALVRIYTEAKTHRELPRTKGEPSVVLWYGLCGLLMFLLTLVRPSASLLAVPVALGLFLHAYFLRGERSPRRYLSLVALALVLPLSSQWAWATRNAVVEGKRYYCRLSAFGIYAFGVALPYDMSRGISAEASHTRSWDEFFRLLDKTSPEEMDRMYKERTLAALKERPAPIAAYLAKSSLFLFLPTLNKPQGKHQYRDTVRPAFWKRLAWKDRALYAFYLMNSAVEMLFIIGITGLIAGGILLLRRLPRLPQQGFMLATALVLLYWIPIHAVSSRYAAPGRFLLPVVPMMIVAAAVVLAEWKTLRKG